MGTSSGDPGVLRAPRSDARPHADDCVWRHGPGEDHCLHRGSTLRSRRGASLAQGGGSSEIRYPIDWASVRASRLGVFKDLAAHR